MIRLEETDSDMTAGWGAIMIAEREGNYAEELRRSS